ncbi:MAG: hypothetical protein ABUK15_07340 [Anaerolineales bacterium]
MMYSRHLAQSRPANTTAVSVYSPPVNTITEITAVVICNTAGTSQDFRIFLDNDGTTYDQTTALFWDVPVPADASLQLDANWWMDNSSGNLAVRTDSASAFTFTVFGSENDL